MARGNARQKIVRDDADRRRLIVGLENTAVRQGRELVCYVIMGDHDPDLARAVATWLCRRHTEASLRQLAEWLGLPRADSVPNRTRRLEGRLKASPRLADDLAEIRRRASAPAAGVLPADVTRTGRSGRTRRAKTKNQA